MRTATLFRPVGNAELDLIRDRGWRTFPPRRPDQPIFYLVLEHKYAAQIARSWNTRDGGKGYVLQFEIDESYLFPILYSDSWLAHPPRVLDSCRQPGRIQSPHRWND